MGVRAEVHVDGGAGFWMGFASSQASNPVSASEKTHELINC